MDICEASERASEQTFVFVIIYSIVAAAAVVSPFDIYQKNRIRCSALCNIACTALARESVGQTDKIV